MTPTFSRDLGTSVFSVGLLLVSIALVACDSNGDGGTTPGQQSGSGGSAGQATDAASESGGALGDAAAADAASLGDASDDSAVNPAADADAAVNPADAEGDGTTDSAPDVDAEAAAEDPEGSLLFKTLVPGGQYDVKVGYSALSDMQDTVSKLASNGYVITAAEYVPSSYTGDAYRYFAYKRIGSTATYEGKVGYADLPDIEAEATQLGSSGYVITTAAYIPQGYTGSAFRYLAFRRVGNAATYQARLGYSELPDIEAEATLLGSSGYVITTAAYIPQGYSGSAFRFLAFRRLGGSATYVARLGYSPLPDAQDDATQLASSGYIVTAASYIPSDYSGPAFRYLSFKESGTAAAYQAKVGYQTLPEMQATASQLGTEGYIVTTAAFIPSSYYGNAFRFFGFRQ